jgi:hypothetical protein
MVIQVFLAIQPFGEGYKIESWRRTLATGDRWMEIAK